MRQRSIISPALGPLGFTATCGARALQAASIVCRASIRQLTGLAWGMLAILVIGLGARLFELGAKPFWLDEVFTAIRSSQTVPGVIVDSLQNRHLPSFFLIEHALVGLGSGPAVLRLVPALAGAATAPFAFAMAWKLGGRTGAWLAGLLLALAPLQVAFGQEARSYTLVMALILLALLGLTILAMHPDRGARRLTEANALHGAWAAYGLGTLGALLVLGDAVPWLIAANIAMAAAILPRTNSRGGLLRNWLLVHGLILLVAVPGYAAMLAAVHDQVLQSFLWIPPLSLRTAWVDGASLYGLRDTTMVTMRLLPTPLGGLAFTVFALVGLGAWRLRHQPGPLIVLGVAFLGLPVTLALASLVHPVLLPRYLLWSVGPFFVLAGFGIEMVPERFRRPALAVAAALLVINLLPYYNTETKPRWERAAGMIDTRFSPGDLLLVSDGAAPVMLDFNRQGVDARHAAWPATQDPTQAAVALSAGHRVFVVYGPAGQGRQPDRARFFATVAKLGQPAASMQAGSEITVQVINPPAEGPAVAGPNDQPRG